MQPLALFVCALGFASALARETVEDAARIARGLVDNSPNWIGTMATVYPSGHELAGSPLALQEYYAPCHTNGSLALLFLPISRHSQNILHAPNHTASLTVAHPEPRASRARVSLIGTVTVFTANGGAAPDEQALTACYLARHPDAKWWLPHDPDGAHVAYWARFDPESIYFVGGFGTSHYIGNIPTDLYQKAGSTARSLSVEDEGEWVFVGHPGAPSSTPLAVGGRILVDQTI